MEDLTINNEKLSTRDEDYIKGLLSLRSKQVRLDWKEAKEKYTFRKEILKTNAETNSEKNQVKRILERIARETGTLYEEVRAKHKRKVKFLVQKYGK